jgi:hypothetical protein
MMSPGLIQCCRRIVGITSLTALSFFGLAFQESGTAAISGVVIDELGQPISRAGVVLLDAQSLPVRSVATDDRGRFDLTGIRAGTFRLTAWKPGYVAGAVGARRAQPSGARLQLRPADRKSFAISLKRSAVIAGHVRDEAGIWPNVDVLVLGITGGAGDERRLDLGRVARLKTNSRGMYRAFDLVPGNYVVAVPITSYLPTGIAVRGRNGSERIERYVSTYAPSSTSISAADVITVAVGETRTDANVRLERVPTGRLDATILSPGGAKLKDVQSSIDTGDLLLDEFLAQMSDVAIGEHDTSLTCAALPQGPHQLFVTAQLDDSVADAASGRLWGAAEFVVGPQPARVTVSLRQGSALSGRFVLEGDPDAAGSAGERLWIELEPARFSLLGRIPAETLAPDRFAFTSVTPGRYELRAGGPPGWTLESATAAGRDISDAEVELGGNNDIENTVLTFTRRGPVLTGRVTTPAGAPMFDATIVAAPADPREWRAGSRRILVAGPDSDGRFDVRGLPAGQYVVAAVRDDVEAPDLTPDRLDQLLRAAVRVTLTKGQTTTQDVIVR